MDPGYQTVMDPATVVWGVLAMLIHLGVMLTQAGLAVFLVGSGLRRIPGSGQRKAGVLRVGLGILLAGAPFAVSLFACLGALATLLLPSRGASGGRPNRWLRGAAIGCAAVTALFMLWEREDELFEGVVPLYVDAMNDAVSARFAAKPTRIYFIGKDGRVLYNPGLGPFGFSPDDLEEVIAEHLAQGS